MTLAHILFFALAAMLAGRFAGSRGRGWALLIGSILAIYWLQPALPIRHLDFWLPTATLGLAVIVWAATRPAEAAPLWRDLPSALALAGTVLGVGLLRYTEPLCCLTPTPPPDILEIAIGLAGICLLAWLAAHTFPSRPAWTSLLVGALLLLFVALKTDALAVSASGWLRGLAGQKSELASALDIRWLGFSYIAFRLIHTLRDRLAGRLPDLSLQAYLVYILFFPAITAGPIDRVQRFVQELDQPFRLTSDELFGGWQRIFKGVFRKFVLADTLAIWALNTSLSEQVSSPGWLWLVLYAYALRLYFDFSGYTDIAIGLGRLLGFNLPENFSHPYRQADLTAFWNSWHITLAQWFRAYYFNPLTRWLRTTQVKLPLPLIIFIGQVSTMLLIGLWHGVTWNFAVWGVWHGLGLFIHNRWVELTRPLQARLELHPRLKNLSNLAGTLLTFQYVALGWVWFALPSPALSWQVLARLFGASATGLAP